MRFQVENPIDRDFGMVPRALWQMPLPAHAKLVASYLFCLRDGAMPYVAEVEAATGLGRDARRKAFAALIAAGLVEWRNETAGGRIVGKTLVLHPAAFRAPENQADGENPRAPENPADGKPVAKGMETRPSTDWISGDTLKGKERKSARAREAARHAQRKAGARQERPQRSEDGPSALPAVEPERLSEFERNLVRRGLPLALDGRIVAADTPEHQALALAVAAHDRLERATA